MIPSPDFITAAAEIQCNLACRSRPKDIVWFFAEDIVAHGGHAFLMWPPQDNTNQVQKRYEQVRTEGGIFG